MATNETIRLRVSENMRTVPLENESDNSPYYVGARAYVTQLEDGATITCIDKDGTTTATVHDGATGAAGQDGADGADGADGFSPIATVSKVGDTATISITDENGTTTANVYDGANGVMPYYTCNSSANNMMKTLAAVSSPLDAITTGCSILVHFENSNTALQAFLTFPDETWTEAEIRKGRKSLGQTPETSWSAYEVVMLTYDGTYWQMNDWQKVPVTDVKVDGSSVVSSDVATIPKGGHNQYGVVQAYDNSEPPAGVLVIKNDNKFLYAPTTYFVEGEGFKPIRPHFLPDATTTTKGAMSASDKQKLDGIASGAEVNVQSDWSQSTNTADDYIKNKPTIPSKTSDLVNDSLYARGHIASFHGTCSTAAATAVKAVTCADFTAADLVAGAIIVVSFDNTNSAAVADLCLNVNSTGAHNIKRNYAGTIGNLDGAGYIKASTSYMFYFDGSYWVMSYDKDTNTIGYTIRTNGLQLPLKTAMYRYRICFTSADGEYLVPANSSTSTNTTSARTVTTEKIDPFGRIVYYNTTTAVAANDYPTASTLCQQYNNVYLGYSFNRTGAALTLTNHKPVYVKCAPQSDGSAIIDADNPFVQALPSTADGKIYIFLGIATATQIIEMTLEHPVYEYKNGHIREYTPTSEVSVTQITSTGTKIATVTVDGTPTDLYAPSGGGGATYTATSPISIDSNNDISHADSGATAGTYGSYNSGSNYYYIPSVTVDAKGHITSASQSYLGLASSKSAGILSASDYSAFSSGGSAYTTCTAYVGQGFAGYFYTGNLSLFKNTYPILLGAYVKCHINNQSTMYWVQAEDVSITLNGTVRGSIPSKYLEFNGDPEGETASQYNAVVIYSPGSSGGGGM